MNQPTKPWYTSLTLWGSFIAAAPQIAALLGLVPDNVLVEEIVTVIGTAIAVIGRFNPKIKPLVKSE